MVPFYMKLEQTNADQYYIINIICSYRYLVNKQHSNANIQMLPVCCHLFLVGGLSTSVTRIAMLTGVFILLIGHPKSDRLKD